MMRMRELTDSARAISTICCCPSRRSSTRVNGSISSSRSAISARSGAPLPRNRRRSRPCNLAPHEDVVAHVEIGREAQFLMDDRDAAIARVGRGGEGDARAVKLDEARGRRHDAGQNLHQRRLAGAVLSEQRGHLAAMDVEVHALQARGCCRRTWRCCAPRARRRRPAARCRAPRHLNVQLHGRDQPAVRD